MHTPFSVDSSGTALQFGARFPHMLSYLGAGIYEELLFRLMLLSGMIALCRQVGAGYAAATALAIMSTSLLFAAAHYELFFHVGLDFTWYSFAFRLVAGALFSGLYLRRGFGIVVGTHVVYDILVATIA
jgi:membrane protease YdiL (CAAX protease family)